MCTRHVYLLVLPSLTSLPNVSRGARSAFYTYVRLKYRYKLCIHSQVPICLYGMRVVRPLFPSISHRQLHSTIILFPYVDLGAENRPSIVETENHIPMMIVIVNLRGIVVWESTNQARPL